MSPPTTQERLAFFEAGSSSGRPAAKKKRKKEKKPLDDDAAAAAAERKRAGLTKALWQEELRKKHRRVKEQIEKAFSKQEDVRNVSMTIQDKGVLAVEFSPRPPPPDENRRDLDISHRGVTIPKAKTGWFAAYRNYLDFATFLVTPARVGFERDSGKTEAAEGGGKKKKRSRSNKAEKAKRGGVPAGGAVSAPAAEDGGGGEDVDITSSASGSAAGARTDVDAAGSGANRADIAKTEKAEGQFKAAAAAKEKRARKLMSNETAADCSFLFGYENRGKLSRKPDDDASGSGSSSSAGMNCTPAGNYAGTSSTKRAASAPARTYIDGMNLSLCLVLDWSHGTGLIITPQKSHTFTHFSPTCHTHARDHHVRIHGLGCVVSHTNM